MIPPRKHAVDIRRVLPGERLQLLLPRERLLQFLRIRGQICQERAKLTGDVAQARRDFRQLLSQRLELLILHARQLRLRLTQQGRGRVFLVALLPVDAPQRHHGRLSQTIDVLEPANALDQVHVLTRLRVHAINLIDRELKPVHFLCQLAPRLRARLIVLGQRAPRTE